MRGRDGASNLALEPTRYSILKPLEYLWKAYFSYRTPASQGRASGDPRVQAEEVRAFDMQHQPLSGAPKTFF